jgi:hypothetical protein
MYRCDSQYLYQRTDVKKLQRLCQRTFSQLVFLNSYLLKPLFFPLYSKRNWPDTKCCFFFLLFPPFHFSLNYTLSLQWWPLRATEPTKGKTASHYLSTHHSRHTYSLRLSSILLITYYPFTHSSTLIFYKTQFLSLKHNRFSTNYATIFVSKSFWTSKRCRIIKERTASARIWNTLWTQRFPEP